MTEVKAVKTARPPKESEDLSALDKKLEGKILGEHEKLCHNFYSGIFYSCQFIKSFRPFHSFWEEEDLSWEINTSFIE